MQEDIPNMWIFLTCLLTFLGGCSSCPLNCIQCNSNNNTCELCDNGYFFAPASDGCDRCLTGCFDCNISTYCNTCMSGYYRTSYNNCYQCHDGCLECNSSSICTSCTSGYYLTSSFSCYQCSAGCLECQSSSFCYSSCTSGYYLTSDNNCYECNAGCLECNSSSTCTSCTSGYYLTSNYKCYQCHEGCFECSSAASCTSCTSGYFLDNDLCIKCNTTGSNTDGNCTTCPPKFYLTRGTCVPCGYNCVSCTDPSGSCEECKQGYYGDTCLYPCDRHCFGSVCEHLSGNCIGGCDVGFYQIGNKCVYCPNHCSSCINGTTCTSCNDGYYLKILDDSTVVCSQCDDTCSLCIQSQCIRLAPTKSPDVKIIYNQAKTAGIAVGTFFIGLGCGITILFIIYKRKATATVKQNPNENPEVSVPTVPFTNPSHTNNTNENACRVHASYVSLVDIGDSPYATIEGEETFCKVAV